MRELPFKRSTLATLGVELEFQIINPQTCDLTSGAKGLMRQIKESPYKKSIKPEITQSMIEINSSVHKSPKTLYRELKALRNFLIEKGDELGLVYSGGGTHPFQEWSLQKIFPTKRFKILSKQYRYLSKRSTVFAEHIHIGCQSGEEALYLTHTMARYIPQLIALSASSPFYQGIDTGYYMSRTTDFNSFPTSGVIPLLFSWRDFSNYYFKMRKLGIIKTMKDIYWDIRPKPEFGTVEIRICDTPLTIKKAVNLAAFVQTLAYYLLKEKPYYFSDDLYLLYHHNYFQACRYGFDGHFINPFTLEQGTIGEDILMTIKTLEKHTRILNNTLFINAIKNQVKSKQNDASLLRKIYKQTGSLVEVAREQCLLFTKG